MYSGLHYTLRDRIIGYVDSVALAIYDIFESANVKYNEGLADKLLFIAGLKKLAHPAIW